MEWDIKMVINVFLRNCHLESFHNTLCYNSMIPTLNSQSSFTARLLGFRSCSRPQRVSQILFQPFKIYCNYVLATHSMHRGTHYIHFHYLKDWTHPMDDSSWVNILWNKTKQNKKKVRFEVRGEGRSKPLVLLFASETDCFINRKYLRHPMFSDQRYVKLQNLPVLSYPELGISRKVTMKTRFYHERQHSQWFFCLKSPTNLEFVPAFPGCLCWSATG